MKWTLFDFNFSLSKKQKTAAAEEKENEKEVVSVEDDGGEAEDVSFGTSASVSPVSKSSSFSGRLSVVVSYSSDDQLRSKEYSLCSH